LWSNHHDAQDYEAPSHHTLSCYIAGGTGTFRRDQPGTKGGPDKLCILPADHQSGWVINGDIRLAHLYFSAGAICPGLRHPARSRAARNATARGTFLEDPQQARRFRQLITLNWDEPAERLLTSSLAHELSLLSHCSRRCASAGLRLKGGLAPHQRRQLVEFIDSQLAEPISLGNWPVCVRCRNTTLRGCFA
jgi:AraC family transcriptional regulator